MLVTAPQIARLLARSRGWAWARIKASDFGPARQTKHHGGRPWFVSLAAVEAYAGTTFTPEQIAAATNTRPAHGIFEPQGIIHEQQ